MGNTGRLARKAVALFALTGAAALCGVAPAAACPPPTAQPDGVIDRAFVQERFLAGIERPLRAQGRLQIDAATTVWHMTAPFDVKTTINADGVTQAIDGGPAAPVGAGAGQIGAQVAGTTAAVLKGQWAELENLFTVTRRQDGPGGNWTISLRPLDPRLAAIISSIEVEGCTAVSTIVVGHPGGDRDVIRFAPDRAAK